MISSTDLAQAVDGEHIGNVVIVTALSKADAAAAGSLFFVRGERPARGHAGAVAIVEANRKDLFCTQIRVVNARLAFAKASALFVNHPPSAIHPMATIDPRAQLGDGVAIGAGSVIGACTIGRGTTVASNVTIADGVVIGANCRIKSGSVIGEDGFGFERDEDGTPVRLHHFGGVHIGENVEIGALNSIASGTFQPTKIGDFTKTDHLVHIAHNCTIGDRCLLTACTEISGSVVIGSRVWTGPNCSIMNGLSIGDDAYIGIGSVVIEDCRANGVYAGVPARLLRDNNPNP